jgi:Ca2+-binding EF-hand superfamily protein
MALRKFRSTTMGQSSGDVRTALETKPERKVRLPLFLSPYPYHEAQLQLPRVKSFASLEKQTLSPQFDRKIQVVSKTAKPNQWTQTLNERFSKTDRLQIGDSARLIKTKQEDKYRISKEIEHKKAVQETQLVHMPYTSTLKDKVDLKKVADIRRTIRRRYASRTDFRKIFKQWDANSVGVLTSEDVFSMVNQIGIPINMKEARVLVASANASNTGALDLDEFMKLIFDQDDRINVDLSLLADEEKNEVKLLKRHTDAVNKQTEMVQKELKGMLKERVYGLIPQFVRKDKGKTGTVSFEEFVGILNNMDLPQHLSSEKAWKRLYQESSNGSGFKYQSFISEIEKFEPETEQIIHKAENTEESKQKDPQNSNQHISPRFNPLGNIIVLDRQKVPVNHLENFFVYARKIRHFLRENSESEGKLLEELKKRGEKSVISLENLAEFVVDKLQEKKTLKITKKELEGFLSSYVFNKDGVTPIDEVANNIFMEDTKADFELCKIKRAVPPNRDPSTAEYKPSTNIKKLLLKIEDKFFNYGSHKSNDVFKSFDQDRDGFVTEEDVEKTLAYYQIMHSKSDVKELMALLDEEKKGYVTFNEFNKVIQTNIIPANQKRFDEIPEKYAKNHQPGLEFLSRQQKKMKEYGKMQEELINSFKGGWTSNKSISNTRYGSNPAFQDTFVHYHMPLACSMSQEIAIPKKIVPFNLGREETLMKIEKKERKIEALRKNREERMERIMENENKKIEKESQKILKRALSKEEYEKRCKMNSPFANMSLD